MYIVNQYFVSDLLRSPADGALLRRSYRRDPMQEDYVYDPHEEDEGVIIQVVDEEGQTGKLLSILALRTYIITYIHYIV